jgi:hypothetical protein
VSFDILKRGSRVLMNFIDQTRDERFKHMITGVKINEQSALKIIERSDL